MGAPPALPDRFGKYFVLGRLAQGGMAEVYKVKTVGIAGFEKIQVLKRILPGYASDPRFIRSFIDEARIAVSLNHRNIVQVFEFGKVDEELFLAMELIDGVNLRDALQTGGLRGVTMPVPMACYVLGEVAAGLDYAHRKLDHHGHPLGIVHCDVSPPNVALSYEGYVKILDFGVARASFATVERGRLRGKPRYMAPEQTRGEVPTAQTDVFALGVVAWELLTGLPLFDGPDVDTILKAIQRAEVPPAQRLNPDVPEALSSAIGQALALDPAARGSAADLAAAFAQAHRETDPGVGSRALARWLGELFPSPVAPPEQLTVTRPGKADPRARAADARAAAGAANDPEPATLGEKRRIVAAACRLFDATTEARAELRRVLADIAYKRGAVVHTAEEPDWLIALFGLELAGEDDVGHALRYATEAMEAVREAARPAQGDEAPVRLQIGVRQGIVSRRRQGEDARPSDGYLLLGDALEETRAIALAAEPGRTLLGGDPGRLATAHFAFREHPPLKRRGRRVKLMELRGVRSPEERRRAIDTPRGVFRGRAGELAELRASFENARRGDQRLVTAVVGEAGIGKSRLVSEFAAALADARPVVLAIAATPGDTPYALVGDLVAAALGVPAGRGAGGRARLVERLARVLGERGVAPDEVDEVVATLGLALELRDGAAAPGAETASANLRDRVTAAIATLRGVDGAPRPRLTIFEDWHWADGASAEVLKQVLSGSPAPGAELVVITCRPDDGGEPPALPTQASPVIRLGELPEAERASLIRDRLGAAADDASVALVARRAGGNPLFIEELASALRDLGPGELPENARGVIAARVDRLPRVAKAALQHAAVMGPVFRARLLEELLGRSVYRAIRLLEEGGILARTLAVFDGDGAEAEEGELTFRHGLIQEVVYDALSGAARRDAHRKIGLLLAERFEAGRAESPAAIARHLELGGEETRGASFYLRAGRLALAAFDARAAVAAFTRALELGVGKESEREREAVSGRAEALFHLGDHEAQRRDLDTLVRLCATDPRRLADVLNRAAVRHLRLGEFAAAVAATESAERAAESGGDERTRGESLRIRAEAFERQADFDRALDAVTRALEIFRRIGAGTEETRALIGTGRIHLMGSRFEAALAHYAPALERVRNSGDQWLERIICNNVSVIHLNRGEFAQAMTNAMRSLEICRRFGDRPREGDNTSIVGTILLELGCYDEAKVWLARGLEIHGQTGSRWSRADALVYTAHRETLAGDPEQGFRWLEECIALAKEIGARYVVANAKNQLALALIRRRAPGDLIRADREAIEAAELGREAALPSCEIQGRSRSALARLESGDALGALAPSMQAVQLLDKVRCIEWSEEEIFYTHYRVLKALADPMAHGHLARAYAGLMAKLTSIDNPEWRSAYADRVELHRKIREEHAAVTKR